MIICDLITNKLMRRDSSRFKRSIQAKFSTNTGQQNVLGDVNVLQNSQLIVKSTVRHDLSVETFCVLVPIFAHRSAASTKSGSDHRTGSSDRIIGWIIGSERKKIIIIKVIIKQSKKIIKRKRDPS